MLESRNLNFLKTISLNKYSLSPTEKTKNDYNQKRKNKTLFLKPRINLSFSKEKIKDKTKNYFINLKQIKIKVYSNKNKQKIPLLNISSNLEKNKNKAFKKRNFSLNNIRPKNYRIKNNPNNEKKNMSKGELVEVIYGKVIKFNYKLDMEIENNKRIKEILYNNPKFILDLIVIGNVDKYEIKDFFNIESFNISWNENLEKTYREIRKTNSNIFKVILFLSKTNLLLKLKQNYQTKNYVNFYNYNQKEIENFYDIYGIIKKYKNEKIKEAFDKIDNIYIIRDFLLKEKISKIRREYYSKIIKNFKEKKKLEINIKEITEKGKIELLQIKNSIFHLRQNTNWKIFPHKKINRLKFSKSITKYNEIIQKEINIKNIEHRDKIKQDKIYIKKKINLLKKEKVFENPNFNWFNFMKKNIENKRIIEYYIIKIQSTFRSFMLKLFLSKLIKGVSRIIINLYEYSKFKKLILTIYQKTLESFDIYNKTNDPYLKLKIINIKNVVRIMNKNCRTRKLIFKKSEVDIINKITEINIGLLPIKENQEIYSNILLINLNKYLSYLSLK